MNFDIQAIREQFPILHQEVYGKPFIYLDNGATTQKPMVVADYLHDFYLHSNSNIHRGVHFYSEQATLAYEEARKKIQRYINAEHEHEIIFTKGTTDSVNLAAFSFGERYISEGDEILITEMEHHSNIVPWQLLCERKKAILKYIPIDERGVLQLETIESLLTSKTKLVAFTHISNSLGTVNPAKKIIDIAHDKGIPVLVDGAQAIQHTVVDVRELDVDFYVFSGHKIYGPTGIGILYGKEKYLNEMPPYQGGGDMIKKVSLKGTTYNDLPFKFEAGTPHYIGAICLGRAIDFIEEIGRQTIMRHENEVFRYAEQQLSLVKGLKKYGNAPEKTGSISFLLEGIHHYDTGMVLDKLGVAVRTGTHCTQPVMDRFGITGTVRASFAMYNTKDEVDVLCSALEKVRQMFG